MGIGIVFLSWAYELIDTVLLIWRSGACRILQTRLKVDQNGVHLGMYSTCNQERETSIQISHGWHLLAIYGQVRMIPTHEKSLPRSFHQNKPTNPQCCSVHTSEFSTMVYINYYYPLIFHRFTPDFPRVFLLLAIYSLISHHIPLIHMISSYPLVN